MSKVVVTIAPTGGMAGKEQNPNLPTQPEEIAESVLRCYEAGASVAAIHARNKDDSPTCDPEIYEAINDGIRDRCDIVINNSTGGGVGGDMVQILPDGRKDISWEERIKGAKAEGAEMVTFDAYTRTAKFGDDEYLVQTTMERCKELGELLDDRGLKPEWEVFSPGDMETAKQLIDMGYDSPPYYFNFVLGGERSFLESMPYSPETIQFMKRQLPDEAVFCVSAIGPAQLPATTASILHGGHIRVGLEDNLYYEKGQLATNEELVERSVRIIRELGHEPATPSEARETMGLA